MNRLTQKMISVFISAAIAGGCIISASAAGRMLGDVDDNGKIDSGDALAVLEHSVGIKGLSGDNFKCADVNGDSVVDSIDALDILSVSVGLKSGFDLEQNVSMSANEILALYTDAIAKARSVKPAYIIKRDDNYKDVDFKISDPLGILKAGGSSAAQMEKEMKDEILSGNSHYESVCIKNSTDSYNNLPAPCLLTDASKLKSIDAISLTNGNYRITIKLNDEKNPTSGSTICKVMGVADYDTTLQDLKESSDIEGAEGLTNIKLNELTYKDPWIVCEVNPQTKELAKYDFGLDVYTSSTVGILTVTVKSDVTLGTVANYTGFVY